MREQIIKMLAVRNGFILDIEDMEELADEIIAVFLEAGWNPRIGDLPE